MCPKMYTKIVVNRVCYLYRGRIVQFCIVRVTRVFRNTENTLYGCEKTFYSRKCARGLSVSGLECFFTRNYDRAVVGTKLRLIIYRRTVGNKYSATRSERNRLTLVGDN